MVEWNIQIELILGWVLLLPITHYSGETCEFWLNVFDKSTLTFQLYLKSSELTL